MSGISIIPVEGLPEIQPGDDLAALLCAAVRDEIAPGDILVVTHKVVSKAEGRLLDLRTVEPSPLAKSFAAEHGKDPRQIEAVLRESRRIVRMDRGLIISETRHGFVCANAGVDASNVPGEEVVCLLPLDPDASAARIRHRIARLTAIDVPVIVSDSFGRPWRNGITNVAIGLSGMKPFSDYRGHRDPYGYELSASVLASADEIAAAAELVMGKTAAVPAALVRGFPYTPGEGAASEMVMDPGRDLFR